MKWVLTKEGKKQIKKNSLVKFTPEQLEEIKKMAKIIESELGELL